MSKFTSAALVFVCKLSILCALGEAVRYIIKPGTYKLSDSWLMFFTNNLDDIRFQLLDTALLNTEAFSEMKE